MYINSPYNRFSYCYCCRMYNQCQKNKLSALSINTARYEMDDLLLYNDYGFHSSFVRTKENTASTCRSNPTMLRTTFTTAEATEVASTLGIDFEKERYDIEQYRVGMNVELEHGKRNALTNVTNDDPLMTGKITLAHLMEFPDYYKRLTKLEAEASAYWGNSEDKERQMKEYTLTELAEFNGSMGKPAYVAVNGIVYDLSTEAAWGGGTHFGQYAGKDLTSQFLGCHDNQAILAKLTKVGILKT